MLVKIKEWFERAISYLRPLNWEKVMSAFLAPISVVLVVILVLPSVLNVASDNIFVYMDQEESFTG